MAGLYFNPWIGRNYSQGGLFNKRVLVLGESHYKWDRRIPVTADLTRQCIREQISGDETAKFWTNTAIAFLGRAPSLQEKSLFWHSVAFSNLIQRPVGFGPRRPPSEEMWAEARLLFRSIIARCKPDLVVALGYRLWIHLPDEWGRRGPSLSGARYSETWLYPHSGGTALAFSIRHPSSGFSGLVWHRVINRGLALVSRGVPTAVS